MKKLLTTLFLLIFILGFIFVTTGQEKLVTSEYFVSEYEPLVLKLSDNGNKYIRFILWNQFSAEDPDLSDNEGYKLRIRRARILSYAQISPRFLILTHFGVNGLNSETMDPLGNSITTSSPIKGPQLFLHAAWSEFKISKDNSFYLGGGLHYWNGLSRFNSASTLNFATLDNHRQSWSQLGLSDQFGRHLGIFAKGEINRFNYSISFNEAITNALGSDELSNLTEGSITYSGKKVFGKAANKVFTGRIEYQVLDRESTKLPYRTGTYLGKLKVLNIGVGFFNHRNGTVLIQSGPQGQRVNHIAGDIYYDAPMGKGAINAYASIQKFDYGKDFILGTTYGSGVSTYAQAGYLLPFTTSVGQFMPYVAFSNNDFEAFEVAGSRIQSGLNLFINGHNAKLTFEFNSWLPNHNETVSPDRINGVSIQTHVFL